MKKGARERATMAAGTWGGFYGMGMVARWTRFKQSNYLCDSLESVDLSFVRNTNGMAKGPKTAPITAQKNVFAPLLSAMPQRNHAHDIHNMEKIISIMVG